METTLIIDTHQFIEDLKAGGFTKEQAESLTRTLQKSDLNHLSTKADLKELERQLESKMKDQELRLVNTLTTRMVGVVGIGVALLALLKLF